MSKLDELQAFIDIYRQQYARRRDTLLILDMLQAALDQCAAAMGEDETYNFVATYVLIDAMHGEMEADDA